MQLTPYESYRPYLISTAYHLLGSYSEAEDIVQDVFLAWEEQDQTKIKSAKGYLRRAVANRSLNRLKALKREREFYTGIWLPEPIPSTSEDLALQDQAYHVSIGLLMVMDKLSPVERAVFVLREVFDWAYDSIASIINESESYCRQIKRRAQQKVRQADPVLPLPTDQLELLIEAFEMGSKSGNIDSLLNLLQEDVVFLSDGGGKVAAARNPIIGKSNVSKFLVGIHRQSPKDTILDICRINETIGLLFRYPSGQVHTSVSIEFSPNGLIKSMYTVRNPDKLRHLDKKK